MNSIRFQIDHAKAAEILVWIAVKSPGLDFYRILKVLFFADKEHLVRYGRPVLGDRYIAMEHGPVPSVVYNMLKEDPFLAPETLKLVREAIRVVRNEGPPKVYAVEGRSPDLRLLSRSDVEVLGSSLAKYGAMSFSRLKEITHAERAYIEAPLNGEMNYELMIDQDVPRRDALIDQLIQNSHRASFGCE
jgi:uncharacterized phage-associated protein